VGGLSAVHQPVTTTRLNRNKILFCIRREALHINVLLSIHPNILLPDWNPLTHLFFLFPFFDEYIAYLYISAYVSYAYLFLLPFFLIAAAYFLKQKGYPMSPVCLVCFTLYDACLSYLFFRLTPRILLSQFNPFYRIDLAMSAYHHSALPFISYLLFLPH
jgi:hypothetical protein